MPCLTRPLQWFPHMRTQITKALWVSEDDPTVLGDCADANSRVRLKRIERCEFLVVAGLIVLSLGLMLPGGMRRPQTVDVPHDLMSKVYNKLVAGCSKDEILNSLTARERRLIREWEICWTNTVPINTRYGTVNPKFLPMSHVVVYGMPEVRLGANKWRGPWYCDATGVTHTLPQFSLSKGQSVADTVRMEKLVRTTRLGTFEILSGGISDMKEIPDIELYDKNELEKYIILKKLMAKDADYLRCAIESLQQIDVEISWFDAILRKSVTRPPLDLSQASAIAFCRAWQRWYEMHAKDFEFTNDFLFERQIPDGGPTYPSGSSQYVLVNHNKEEKPT